MSMEKDTASNTLKPDEYIAINDMQRENSIHALELLQGFFGSEDSSDHQFLDVGCGTGDFTRDNLLPRLPPCQKIVAVDVSKDMVQYAKKHFAHPKIFYDVLDISSQDVSDFVERHGQFDRVYSFFCFHWMKDQETVFKNVARLMKPGVGCLLVFNASSPTMRLRKKMANMERWKKYKEVCESSVPPSVNLADKEALIAYMTSLLKSAELTPTTCEVLRLAARKHSSLEQVIHHQMVMNRLTTLVTDEERPLLLNDVTEQATKWWAEKEAGGSSLDGQVFLVHAFKPLC
ncbi:unnamed protein product [Ixodes hexagonus]